MFDDLFEKYTPQKAENPSKERTESDKNAVLSRVNGGGESISENKKASRRHSTVTVEEYVPKKRPKKLYAALTAIASAAAVIAVTTALLPVIGGINSGKNSSESGAPNETASAYTEVSAPVSYDPSDAESSEAGGEEPYDFAFTVIDDGHYVYRDVETLVDDSELIFIGTVKGVSYSAKMTGGYVKMRTLYEVETAQCYRDVSWEENFPENSRVTVEVDGGTGPQEYTDSDGVKKVCYPYLDKQAEAIDRVNAPHIIEYHDNIPALSVGESYLFTANRAGVLECAANGVFSLDDDGSGAGITAQNILDRLEELKNISPDNSKKNANGMWRLDIDATKAANDKDIGDIADDRLQIAAYFSERPVCCIVSKRDDKVDIMSCDWSTAEHSITVRPDTSGHKEKALSYHFKDYLLYIYDEESDMYYAFAAFDEEQEYYCRRLSGIWHTDDDGAVDIGIEMAKNRKVKINITEGSAAGKTLTEEFDEWYVFDDTLILISRDENGGSDIKRINCRLQRQYLVLSDEEWGERHFKCRSYFAWGRYCDKDDPTLIANYHWKLDREETARVNGLETGTAEIDKYIGKCEIMLDLFDDGEYICQYHGEINKFDVYPWSAIGSYSIKDDAIILKTDVLQKEAEGMGVEGEEEYDRYMSFTMPEKLEYYLTDSFDYRYIVILAEDDGLDLAFRAEIEYYL